MSRPTFEPATHPHTEDDSHWRQRAACLGLPSDVFIRILSHPETDNWEPTQAVCAGCPVQVECLDYAVNHPRLLYGVWGGHTPRQIKRLRAQRFQEATA